MLLLQSEIDKLLMSALRDSERFLARSFMKDSSYQFEFTVVTIDSDGDSLSGYKKTNKHQNIHRNTASVSL